MDTQQKTIVCREGGADCDWEVRDSDADELLTAAQGHAKRKHGMDVTPDQIRPAMRDVEPGERARPRGI